MLAGFTKVACVNLLEDYNQKDYWFALYDTEHKQITISEDGSPEVLVVVNAGGKNNRKLGTVKEIKLLEEYGKGVNAQVVAVANMSAFNDRIEEEKRKKEIAVRKKQIEDKLAEEINKRKTLEYYVKMAEEFPDLAEMVNELKELGV